ncbi:hypothetical protein QE152_g6696 [Popillia japonica]|uniref:Gustatory receptor n=1 Tax=Popillia japonica TaxID=7064 RepID=A0AAW1MHJ7_POPJA
MIIHHFKKIKAFLLKKRQKTFLEKIDYVLIFGNIFGCVFFSIKKKPAYINIIISLPLQALFIAHTTNYLYNFNGENYKTTEVLDTSDLFCMVLMLTAAVLHLLYFLIWRNQYRKLIIKMDELNKFLDMERSECYRINYTQIGFITTVTIVLIIMYNVDAQTMQKSLGRCADLGVIFISFGVNDYLLSFILKEKHHQLSVLNRKIVEMDREFNSRTIKEDMKRISVIVNINQMVNSSAVSLNNFFNLSLVFNLTGVIISIIRMLDFLFVILSVLVVERMFDIAGSLACIGRIIGALLYLRAQLKNWMKISEEVSKAWRL